MSLKPLRVFSKCLLLLFFATKSIGQQKTQIHAELDTITHSFLVTQKIIFTNPSTKPIQKIILNDWNNAYSDKYSKLGKRFSDEYIRSFHLAKNTDRGYTSINAITSHAKPITWNREEQVDLVTLSLDSPLAPKDSITFELNYKLQIPDLRFTRFGHDQFNYYVNNCFLSVSRINETGEFSHNSNENLEDITNAFYQKIELQFDLPVNYYLSSNLIETSSEKNSKKTYFLHQENCSEIMLALEKKSSFTIYKNDQIEVETNLTSNKISNIQQALIVDKVTNYVAQFLGKSATSKIMVSQTDYERNPFYGLNQLPAFLSPFQNDFIFELKFLKAYLHNYLKAALKTDTRKEGYIFDAIQVYTMMKYMEENYPDMKLLGNVSSFKLLKGYAISKAGFNDQYNYLFLLMGRKNLDQSITDSRETLIKFNEQISGKYKAGLDFYYLNEYLQDGSVQKSFKEFLWNNRTRQATAKDLEQLLEKNATKDIAWFFPNIIQANSRIDYTFGRKENKDNQISVVVQNNSDKGASAPITISGIKDKKIVFTQWLPAIKKDSTLTFQKDYIDKLVLNQNHILPEYKTLNNYKSLKTVSFNRPIKFNFMRDFEDSEYQQIFYTPEIGYNLYDGALLSLTFKNKSLLDKPFTYSISPSYATATNSMTGSMRFSYNQQIRDSRLYNISYGIGGAYYHYIQDAAYLKVTPFVSLSFRDLNLRSNKRENLSLRTVFVSKENSHLLVNSSSPLNYAVVDAGYSFGNSEMSKSLGYGTGVSFGSDFGKITTEAGFRKLFENNYQVSLRFFGGYYLYNNDVNSYAFGLDRPRDILFDYSFYGRSETKGFFSQQIIIAEGGFKSKIPNAYANQWMTSMNVTSSIWHWIQMYGDVALYQNKNSSVNFAYDSGIHLNLVPDYFELFLPVYSSNGFELGQKNYYEKVRFIVTFSPKTLISLFTRKWF